MGAGLARKAVGEEFSGAGVAPGAPLIRCRVELASELPPVFAAIATWIRDRRDFLAATLVRLSLRGVRHEQVRPIAIRHNSGPS